ncbi:BAHD family acyltransferase, clade IV [Selaginella moellendorffii]|uniref:BAHD family acyltransferase, clade IV n=2 Tax=Selaginella moellendorffii TaxID=88036 RepID=D8QXF7_SELML|nr:BAHD family acyltransferase, clade IV [Selaginella moellendorffii]
MIERSSSRWVSSSIKNPLSTWFPLTPIDIHMPLIHSPLVLAFSSPVPEGFVADLERAIQQVLCHYRDLAGRIRRNESGKLGIYLNDQDEDCGVLWIEASTQETLQGFSDQDLAKLHELTPMASQDPVNMGIPLLLQITRFGCGGIALGFGVNHRVVDCNALPEFLLDLAKLTRGERSIEELLSGQPIDRSCMMPRRPPRPSFDHSDYTTNIITMLSSDEAKSIVTRTIHFTRERLALLKSECNKGRSNQPFSTYVSLSAYLWKSITAAREVNVQSKTIILCPVNGRRGLALPAHFFGNAVFRRCACATVCDILAMPLGDLASLIAAGLESLSQEDYLRSVVDFLALKQQHEDQQRSSPQAEEIPRFSFDPNLIITSWARLPFYELDFGFGRPVLATPTEGPCEGYVRVVPSSNGDGGLAVVPTLRNAHMDKLVYSIFNDNKDG